MFSTGCAIIEEVRADGTASRSVALAAPINVLPPSPDQGRVVKMTGVGVAMSNETLTLGYFNNSEIVLDPTCEIVLVGNTDEQLKHFAELTGNAKGICSDNITKGEKK